MAANKAAQETEMEHLMVSGVEDMAEVVADSSSGAESRARSSGSHGRLAVVAGTALVAALLVTALALRQRARHGLRATAWSGQDDIAEDFDFHMPKSLKTFEEEMKGLTGTCDSGPQCNGNPGATLRTCDDAGKCQNLPEPFCCESLHSKLKTAINSKGEVTCSCSTTSKTLQSFENKLHTFENRGEKVLNRIRAVTGQCLTGASACADQGPSKSFGGVMHCCPKGYQDISTVKVGLTTTCSCK